MSKGACNVGESGKCRTDVSAVCRKKITKLLALKEDMDFEMYWDGACSAERILEFAPKGMKGFVLGTTLLFGKDRPYGEILRDIRDLRL